MILLIDNYDSFSYNLYQMIGALGDTVCVKRNDELSVAAIEEMQPRAIVLSPGPGKPHDAGICEDVVCNLGSSIPLLGVCLGHQAIVEAFGGVVGHARQLMHGKSSLCEVDTDCPLFFGVTSPLEVGRYHSLSAVPESLPSCLKITARAPDGEIMAVQHREYPVFGLQFHPESIMTPQGLHLMKNFLEAADCFNERNKK